MFNPWSALSMDCDECVSEAKRKTGPHCRREVERHPGNLVLPLRKIMRHHPACPRVTKTLERTQYLVASGKTNLPAIQVHRHVDGDEKSEISCDPENCDGNAYADLTCELRKQ